MRHQSHLFLSFFFLLASCAELNTGRTYLSEMEHDDSHFFNPNSDFPVVMGDEGEIGMDESERRDRTPASEDDLSEMRLNSSLKNELRELEGHQSEEGLKLYEQHRKQLSTTSEKIYFLKLSPHERAEYLDARGFLPNAQTQITRGIASEEEGHFGLRRNEVALGMKKQEVLNSLGKPLRVEIAGNPSNENERWAYRSQSATKYIYFESGHVQGWE